jgi:hypothetical protein
MTDRRRLPVSSFLRPCPDCGAKFIDRELRHEGTCPAGNGLDAVTQDDARYFENHPDEQIRVRPITPAEIIEWAHIDGVHIGAGARIVVHNIRPGFRTRSLLP